jgi:hypothetical protein
MWSSTGPDGPGYYGMSGNERIKMSPGGVIEFFEEKVNSAVVCGLPDKYPI